MAENLLANLTDDQVKELLNSEGGINEFLSKKENIETFFEVTSDDITRAEKLGLTREQIIKAYTSTNGTYMLGSINLTTVTVL